LALINLEKTQVHILRVATVYEPDIKALPAEFRSVLTKDDVKAIKSGPEYFIELAKGITSPKWLRKILLACGESGYELQFYSSGDSPYRPYYRFQWGGMPAISLPRSRKLRRDMPDFLRTIYGIVGEFGENGFGIAGGLHPGDDLGPVSDTFIWVNPDSKIDPRTAIPFLETFSGSQLCYLPDGEGAWLVAGEFRKVKSLEREVSRYFESLLQETRI
jgi:hypothetical protein